MAEAQELAWAFDRGAGLHELGERILEIQTLLDRGEGGTDPAG